MNPPSDGRDLFAAQSGRPTRTSSAGRIAVSAPAPATTAQSTTSHRNEGQFSSPARPQRGQRLPEALSGRGDDVVVAEDPEALTPSSTESWVEVDSQPSSSSLSSIDEIVITGLRVGHGMSSTNGGTMPVQPQRRRRLLQQVEDAVSMSTHSRPASTAASAAAASSAASTQRRASAVYAPVARRATESSQEVYDETESEADSVMASSTEHVHVRHPMTPPQNLTVLQQQAQAQMLQRAAASDGDDEGDDDDEGTALGLPTAGPPTFQPQPNAFSHPPNHLQQQRSVPSPHQHLASTYARRTSSLHGSGSATRASRGSGPPFLGPPREDNDADLRASLTTLLSCAAAARGRPKKESGAYGESSAVAPGLRPSNRPMEMCLVPESELMSETPAPARTRSAFQPMRLPPQAMLSEPTASASAARPNIRSSNRPSAHPTGSGAVAASSSRASALSAASSSSKSKRAACGTGNASKPQRVTKKKRTSTTDNEGPAAFLTPTMLTWVVSAGVVVLVSVVSFGAGFVIGREVGKQEAASVMPGGGLGGSVAANTTSCGHEIMRSSTGSTLRRFRWGAGMTKAAMA